MRRASAVVKEGRRVQPWARGSSTYVYRWYDTEYTLLYVGIAIHPEMRFSHHHAYAWWWEWADNVQVEARPYPRIQAEAQEQWAIENEGPI